MKIHNRKELQNLAINHSADIDYKDFMNIYRKCASDPYPFLIIDTTLPADNSLHFRKNILNIKMTLNDEIKILDNKIKACQSQYNLDREAAKISAVSSGELEKNEYLTGKGLGYKPGLVEPAKYEYSPLGNFFNKGFKKYYKKEGLLKIFKNIKG